MMKSDQMSDAVLEKNGGVALTCVVNVKSRRQARGGRQLIAGQARIAGRAPN